jgi:hypothetical protein
LLLVSWCVCMLHVPTAYLVLSYVLLANLAVLPVIAMKLGGATTRGARSGRQTNSDYTFCLRLQACQRASARRTLTATPPQNATSAAQARSAAVTEAWTSAKPLANASPCHLLERPHPVSAATAASLACNLPSAASYPQTPA